MVKAELTILFNDKDQLLHIDLDLLKREDYTDEEFELAQKIEESLILMIDLLKSDTRVKEKLRKIIKEKQSNNLTIK